MAERCQEWNLLLRQGAEAFVCDAEKASVMVFSAQKVISDVLDDPLEFDFQEVDVEEAAGVIWEDGLHLTPAVHKILAEQLCKSVSAR